MQGSSNEGSVYPDHQAPLACIFYPTPPNGDRHMHLPAFPEKTVYDLLTLLVVWLVVVQFFFENYGGKENYPPLFNYSTDLSKWINHVHTGRKRWGIGAIHGGMLQCELHSIMNENTSNKLQARAME
jgi:hypothetical protein